MEWSRRNARVMRDPQYSQAAAECSIPLKQTYTNLSLAFLLSCLSCDLSPLVRCFSGEDWSLRSGRRLLPIGYAGKHNLTES